MSLKLRALGLAVLAVTSISAFVAVQASATVSGHFLSDASGGHTIVDQEASVESTHALVFRIGASPAIQCDKARALGTAAASTVQQVEGSTELSKCHTEEQEPGTVVVDSNGCTGRARSNSAGALTADLVCPAGKTMLFTHPNCTISLPPQNDIGGFTPTTIIENGKHAITIDVNVKYTTHYEGGICVFLGTTQQASVVGGTIIKGLNTQGEQVSITST
jgi:hypothetical protein